jgi:2'-5' RNA ligase
LPETLILELEELQRKLKPFARDAKWVKPSGIHLTLKFLGYVEPERIAEIRQSLQEVAKNSTSVFVRSAGCGFFPNPRRPNVLWAGVESPDILPLANEIEERMSALGFEKEKRAYNPHLTLARFRDHRGLLPLSYEVEKFSGKLLGEFTADHFSLYESILRPQGAEYQVLQEFFLTQRRRDAK